MTISKEIDFDYLLEECWGCEDTLNEIQRRGLEDEFMQYLEESFSDEYPDMQSLNDFIRYDDGATLKYLRENYPQAFEDDEEDE